MSSANTSFKTFTEDLAPGKSASDFAATARSVLHSLSSLPTSVVLASISINCTGLVLPLVVMQVYDRVLPNQATETLFFLCTFAIIVLVVEAVIRVTRAHVVLWMATRAAWRTHDETIKKVLGAPTPWWEAQSASHIVDRLRAVTSVMEWQGTPSRLVLLDLPFAAVFLTVLAIVGGPIALVPIIVFLVVGTSIWWRAIHLRRATADVAQCESRINDYLVETLSGAQAIKGNALEAQMQRRYERLHNAAAVATNRQITLAEDARALADLLASLTQVATMAVGAAFVMSQSMTIGTLACCTLLAGRTVQPLLRCVGMWNELQTIAVDHAKGEPIRTLPTPQHIERFRANAPLSVRFSSVSTASRADVSPTLIDADLELTAGSSTAILGHAGPGTSPIVALLTGRIEPQSGTIDFDGGDRHAIVCVSAMHKPLEGTLLDNLTGFDCSAVGQAALDAARLIGLEEDIHYLPAGYATRVGGNASEVPEGILRRVAVARAIAQSPGLLILDGANESLDSEAERRLATGLKQIEGLVTLLIVTNRPSFARTASKVMTITDGGIHRMATAEARVAT